MAARHFDAIYPNPGRLNELLRPAVRLAINHQSSELRKTKFDAVAVSIGRSWVSIDSRLPNIIVRKALQKGMLREFSSFQTIIPETLFGKSRIDFLLKSGGKRCLLEVKSCTLVNRGVAMFPDAPTARGRRHLLDLIKAKRQGLRACVMFVIQRSDALFFIPNRRTDQEFADTLILAKRKGVEVYARKCIVKGLNISLGENVPVRLS